MTSETSGAVPGSPATWPGHAGGAAADSGCATRLSLVRGAMGAAPCKAPVGGGVGGPRADRGLPAPAAGAAAPRPVSGASWDFSHPPLVEPGGVEARDASGTAASVESTHAAASVVPAILAPPTSTSSILARQATSGQSRSSAMAPASAAGRTSAPGQQLAAMSAGRAAPTPADERGLSASAATPSTHSLRSGSLRALRVTEPRPGVRTEVEGDGAVASAAISHEPSSAEWGELAALTTTSCAADEIARRHEGGNLHSAPPALAALGTGITGREVRAANATKPGRRGKPAKGGNRT
jgi:hypothetical protein